MSKENEEYGELRPEDFPEFVDGGNENAAGGSELEDSLNALLEMQDNDSILEAPAESYDAPDKSDNIKTTVEKTTPALAEPKPAPAPEKPKPEPAPAKPVQEEKEKGGIGCIGWLVILLIIGVILYLLYANGILEVIFEFLGSVISTLLGWAVAIFFILMLFS